MQNFLIKAIGGVCIIQTSNLSTGGLNNESIMVDIDYSVFVAMGAFAITLFAGAACEANAELHGNDGRFCSDCKYWAVEGKVPPCNGCLHNPDKPNWVKDDGEI